MVRSGAWKVERAELVSQALTGYDQGHGKFFPIELPKGFR